MNEWIDTELAENQLHDLRHTKRLAHLLARLSEQAASRVSRRPATGGQRRWLPIDFWIIRG